MVTPPPCHVLALLGLSPAVITQLVWHLVAFEGHTVASVTLWTTEARTDRYAGMQGLTALRAMWSDLRAGLGDRADHVPTAITDDDVHAFQLHGEALGDITTTEAQRSVTEQLDAAVREAVARLPDNEPLIGGIAGGRKPMSGSLLLAFALRARPLDRLVYVGLHPDIDRRKFDDNLRSYGFPTPEWAKLLGRPMNEQVYAYDVEVPPLATWIGEGGGAGRRRILDPDLHATGRAVRRRHEATKAILAPDPGRCWRLEMASTDDVLALKPSLAKTLALLVKVDRPVTDGQLANMLRISETNATRYVQRLVAELRPFLPAHWLPERDAEGLWTLQARSRFDVSAFRFLDAPPPSVPPR